jgi:hypothetical protein
MIIAGKPTAKIFNAGAALVITPIHKFTNNIESIKGIATSTAPRKTMPPQ